MIHSEVKQHILSYIAFGSNQGDREDNLEKTSQAVRQIQGCELLRVSHLYLTEPHTIDKTPQAWYLNCVFEIQTGRNPSELFEALKEIEKNLSRVNTTKWAPRPVDLDILFYGDEVFENKTLCVPHREIFYRRFVLQPLCDLVPEKIHPVLKKSLQELLAECQDKHEIRRV